MTFVAHFSPRTYTFLFSAGDKTFSDGTSEMALTVTGGEDLPFYPTPVTTDPSLEFDGWFTESGQRWSYGSSPVNLFCEDSPLANYGIGYGTKIKLSPVFNPRMITVTLDYNDGSMLTEVLAFNYGESIGDLAAYEKDTGTE